MYQDGVSVIVCCYNSALRLPQTLKHLALQEVPKEISWEIIVVNNNSTDNTVDIASNEWLKLNSPAISFKIVNELKPGLSHAREKGLQTSEFDFIIFCDDDNWLDNKYLTTAYEIISKNKKIAVLGGQSTAISTISLPDWFEDSKTNYAVGKQAEYSRDVCHRKHLWGSGIVLRKQVYINAFENFPSLLTGRKGEELSSGEDSEMCMRFILMGYQLFYSESLTFKHFISQERLTEDYNNKLIHGFIKAHEILKIYAQFIDVRNLGIKEKYTLLTKSLLRLLISRITKIKRWNTNAEKSNIYLTAGFPFKAISKNEILIRQFIKRCYSNGYNYR